MPVLIVVDPIAETFLHFFLDSSDTEGVKASPFNLKELGANPRAIFSDPDKAYPGAISAGILRVKRQLCWFHILQIFQKHINLIFVDWRKALLKAETLAAKGKTPLGESQSQPRD
jgi:hypothetical protein